MQNATWLYVLCCLRYHYELTLTLICPNAQVNVDVAQKRITPNKCCCCFLHVCNFYQLL